MNQLIKLTEITNSTLYNFTQLNPEQRQMDKNKLTQWCYGECVNSFNAVIQNKVAALIIIATLSIMFLWAVFYFRKHIMQLDKGNNKEDTFMKVYMVILSILMILNFIMVFSVFYLVAVY